MLDSKLEFLGIMKYLYSWKKKVENCIEIIENTSMKNIQGNIMEVSEGCRPYITDFLKRILDSISMYISSRNRSQIEQSRKKPLYS